MRIGIVIFAIAALGACSDEPAQSDAAGLTMAGLAMAGLTMENLASVRIGMTRDELQAAAGPLPVPENADAASCFYLSRADRPGVLFMMVEDALQRIDVRAGATPTDTGLRIGDTAAKVHAAYGDSVDVQPHKYEWESGAQYLTVFSPDKTRALRFTTSGGKITSFQAGNADPVQWVEGCS